MHIPQDHPDRPPVPYVVPPGPHMGIVKHHRHIDESGRCYFPYLASWTKGSSNLVGLLLVMVEAFSKAPPLCGLPVVVPDRPDRRKSADSVEVAVVAPRLVPSPGLRRQSGSAGTLAELSAPIQRLFSPGISKKKEEALLSIMNEVANFFDAPTSGGKTGSSAHNRSFAVTMRSLVAGVKGSLLCFQRGIGLINGEQVVFFHPWHRIQGWRQESFPDSPTVGAYTYSPIRGQVLTFVLLELRSKRERDEFVSACQTLTKTLVEAAVVSVECVRSVGGPIEQQHVTCNMTFTDEDVDADVVVAGLQAWLKDPKNRTYIVSAADMKNDNNSSVVLEAHSRSDREAAQSVPRLISVTPLLAGAKKIGRGGCSEVFASHWKGSPCVIKVLTPMSEPMTLQQEIDVLMMLRHPHVIQIFGYSYEPPAIVLEHAIHGSLDKLLIKARPNHIPSSSAIDFLYQIACGMVYLHEQNILHRDLKPGNILVVEGLKLKLTDFGLSRVREETMMSTSAMGTVIYMAPECFSGHFGRASDVYAYGITSFEVRVVVLLRVGFDFLNFYLQVVTLTTPFDRTPPIVVMKKVEGGVRPNLQQVRDSELRQLIESCWPSEPDKRSSFAALQSQLASLRTKNPVTLKHSRAIEDLLLIE